MSSLYKHCTAHFQYLNHHFIKLFASPTLLSQIIAHVLLFFLEKKFPLCGLIKDLCVFEKIDPKSIIKFSVKLKQN